MGEMHACMLDQCFDDKPGLKQTAVNSNSAMNTVGLRPSAHTTNDTEAAVVAKDTEDATYRVLRRKYSSKKMIIPSSSKNTSNPKCGNCGGLFHIQSDPLGAYNGCGIICEQCGKNSKDNPELLLDDHYYKCEQCDAFDMCSKCYLAEKQKLNTTKN
mmetsp:Transcript_1595/g.3074  ORF Transcript_1595/g.3074 Transcript_1595/m.3074 type:complete len:157 (-) Transcript_1595:181-651(-)